MTPEEAEYDQLLKEVAFGNAEAYNYLKIMSKVFRAWDDLWDGDKKVEAQDADDVFSSLSFDLSRNGFFKKHREVLEGFVFVAWNAWQDSNEWRGSKDRIKGLCAWFIRDWCNDIDAIVAWLVGGKWHARQMSLKCREYYLKRLQSRGLDGFVTK